MKKKDSENLFLPFSKMIANKMGLHLTQEDWESTVKKLEPINDILGFDNTVEGLKWLIKTELSNEHITLLAKYLTIGETYFFRDANLFNTLENVIFPELIKNKRESTRQIKIWSAACCTGEEPYSIAILLHRLLPEGGQWKISILGTDINMNFLQKAEKGIYKNWSFRKTPKSILEKYFLKDDEDRFVLIPEVRKMVRFSYLNLVEDKYPAILNGTNAIDLILCNNVLIYFSQENIKRVITQLSHALSDSGWMSVSSIEVPYVKEKKLLSCRFNDTILFRKLSEENSAPLEKYKETFKSDLISFLPLEIKSMPLSDRASEVFLKPILNYENLYNEGLYTELVEELEKKLSDINVKNIGRLTEQYSKEILLLAKAFANLGQLENAKGWTEKILKIQKLNPDAYFLYATLLQELGDADQAIEFLKKTLFLNSEFIMAYYLLGNLLLQTKNYIEAARNFRNALQLLKKMNHNAVLEGAEGITAGHLEENIKLIQQSLTLTKN